MTFKKHVIAIGDIHGVANTLKLLLRTVSDEFQPADTQLIFLGDLVDRGPNSDAVVDVTCEAFEMYPGSILILGNHDHFFREFLRCPHDGDDLCQWAVNGGVQTIESYGFDFSIQWDWEHQKLIAEEIKERLPSHVALLESAVSFVVTDSHFFTHAGVDPERPLTDQFFDDLMWIREGFLDFDGLLPKTIVHGHTITNSEMPEVHQNRIALDTGSFSTGRISAALFVDDILNGFVVAEVTAHGESVRFFDAAMGEVIRK